MYEERWKIKYVSHTFSIYMFPGSTPQSSTILDVDSCTVSEVVSNGRTTFQACL